MNHSHTNEASPCSWFVRTFNHFLNPKLLKAGELCLPLNKYNNHWLVSSSHSLLSSSHKCFILEGFPLAELDSYYIFIPDGW